MTCHVTAAPNNQFCSLLCSSVNQEVGRFVWRGGSCFSRQHPPLYESVCLSCGLGGSKHRLIDDLSVVRLAAATLASHQPRWDGRNVSSAEDPLPPSVISICCTNKPVSTNLASPSHSATGFSVTSPRRIVVREAATVPVDGAAARRVSALFTHALPLCPEPVAPRH